MDIHEDYLYTKEHEWINIEDSIGVIGITDYAQENLGDITFIEMPSLDTEVEQFEQLASIESVKAASDIFSPMSGKIVDVNSELEKEPGIINKSCFENGWIAKIKISDFDERSNLMKAFDYSKYVESLG